MASPLGGPAANLLVLLKVILLATLVVSAVAVSNVPGPTSYFCIFPVLCVSRKIWGLQNRAQK